VVIDLGNFIRGRLVQTNQRAKGWGGEEEGGRRKRNRQKII